GSVEFAHERFTRETFVHSGSHSRPRESSRSAHAHTHRASPLNPWEAKSFIQDANAEHLTRSSETLRVTGPGSRTPPNTLAESAAKLSPAAEVTRRFPFTCCSALAQTPPVAGAALAADRTSVGERDDSSGQKSSSLSCHRPFTIAD